MFLLFGAFVAGMLTVLAPCVLPLLPVIIGGSVSGSKKRNYKKPLIITASLAASLMLFTLLLKTSTIFINVDPESFNYFSGALIIVIGLLSLFPSVYERILAKTGIQSRSQRLLGKGTQNKNEYIGPIVTGAALGPVFSSCSPVYAYILATVLPSNFGQAIAYISAYVLGLSLILLLIAILGQRFVGKLKKASNPKGLFQRSVAVIFILVGLLVFTGSAKSLQTWVSNHTPFDFDGLSSKLIPDSEVKTNKDILNVTEPYDAPEFTGLEGWINSEPMTANDLKGKVTLIDFWTYSCINCIRTQPYLKGWQETYKDSGFQVIGMHAPEFAFEKIKANVEKAAKDAGLSYPIALDNEFATWNNYKVRSWPTAFLIDAEGKVRRFHEGEGEYKETEQAIRALLQENNKELPKMFIDGASDVPVSAMQTPETYLGSKRATNYIGQTRLFAGQTEPFVLNQQLNKNQWSLGGKWKIESEKITAERDSVLSFSISAKEVYIVGSADSAQKIEILIDGQPASQTKSAGDDVKNSTVTVQDARLYKLVKHSQFEDSFRLELRVPEGTSLNVFTFGG